MSIELPPEPLIPVYAIEDALAFRCPFCRRIHWHGRADATLGEITHRGAHCVRKSSPLRAKGVALLIVGELPSTRALPRWGVAAIVSLNQKVAER